MVVKLGKHYLWAVLVLFLVACNEEHKPAISGQAAPAFTLDRLAGGTLHFPVDLKGRKVAILFWADWCPPCLSEMKALAPVYAKYRSQGLEILAINLRQDKTTVAKLVKQMNLPYVFLLDINGEVAQRYSVKNLPASFIMNEENIIKTRMLGETTAETFEQLVRGMSD